jgi:predicted ATPase
MAGLLEALAAYLAEGNKLFVPLFQGLIAELEAEGNDADGALARIDEALALASQTGERWTDALLHRIRGAILLKRDPANPAPAEEAILAAIAIAQAHKARSFELRAALSLAKLYQSTARPADAHAVLALTLEGFAPTPEIPEIAEAQSLLGSLAETEEVKAAEAQRQRRAHLQTAYGQAMMWAKGFSAEETRTAFSRATEITAKTDSFADRFAAAHFRWSLAFMRGELRSSRELELSFLKEAEEAGRIVEAGVARRGLALSCYAATDFLEARTHCERALETCEPERERETRERLQSATGPIVMPILAVTMWQLGEVERARELIEEANRRASDLGDAPSMVHPLLWKVHLGILRGDPVEALSAAEALERLCVEHGMSFWRTAAEPGGAWARGRLHDAAAGAEDLRRALADRAEQDARFDAWYFTGLLAELEAKALGTERALARLDEAMALARQVETRCNLPFLHLLRGKLLLERDPSNPFPAEEAFRTALAIAQEQGARSWGLRAALSLAKLYQSTARPAQAHAVLAPALEGFSPTPEMPEIAEAQTLLAALAETEGVEAAIAQRQRRLDLQTSYAQAVLWSKGWAADETKAAFERVGDVATRAEFRAGRFPALYGQAIWRLIGGDVREARVVAQRFLDEAQAEGQIADAAVARRQLGFACLCLGDLAEARSQFELALDNHDQERDRNIREKYGEDTGVSSRALLAHASWMLGELRRARQLAEEAIRLGDELHHLPSASQALGFKMVFEAFRKDYQRVIADANNLLTISERHCMVGHVGWAGIYLNWAQAMMGGDATTGAAGLCKSLAALKGQGHRLGTPFFLGLRAELESAADEHVSALALIDEGLALAQQSGEQYTDAHLHCLRGNILLKHDPDNPSLAEEAFQAAVAVAKQQGSRSFGLRAALSLAKVYQPTGRPAEAYAVLAPALEGFSPTPEMPEIADAQALLDRLLDGSGRPIDRA